MYNLSDQDLMNLMPFKVHDVVKQKYNLNAPEMVVTEVMDKFLPEEGPKIQCKCKELLSKLNFQHDILYNENQLSEGINFFEDELISTGKKIKFIN